MQQPVPFTDDYAISMRQRMSPWRGLAVDDVSAVCAAIVAASNASKSGSNSLKLIMILICLYRERADVNKRTLAVTRYYILHNIQCRSTV